MDTESPMIGLSSPIKMYFPAVKFQNFNTIQINALRINAKCWSADSSDGN